MPNGVSWPVYFGVGSAEIDKIAEGPTGKKHQGHLLDERDPVFGLYQTQSDKKNSFDHTHGGAPSALGTFIP
jgi:hypothetical protein